MKRFIILLAILTSSLAIAQPKGPSRDHPRNDQKAMHDFTPEQVAELQTKQLTLVLDLNAKQQSSVKALNLKMAQDRKANSQKRDGQKLDSEQRYQRMITHLDNQIEVKASFKSILNAEQYEKWQKLRHHKKDKKQRSRRGKRR
ncbi:MAG: hypothetical protein ABJM06_14265 [Gilvibacter sp.]